jgi:hypothetical protein
MLLRFSFDTPVTSYIGSTSKKQQCQNNNIKTTMSKQQCQNTKKIEEHGKNNIKKTLPRIN